MDSVYAPRFFIAGVPPFGYPRIKAYLQLPAAFRSLSRPSSAPNAKAFSVCSSSLELLNRTVCSRFFVLRSNCCVSYLQFLWQNCFLLPCTEKPDFPEILFSLFHVSLTLSVMYVTQILSLKRIYMMTLIRFSMNIQPFFGFHRYRIVFRQFGTYQI